MKRTLLALALAATLVPLAAAAQPMRGGAGMGRMHPPPDRGQRERMLRKIHTMAVLELGDLLGLSTDDTIRLADRLKPFDDQRVELQLSNFDAMQALKAAAEGRGGDPATLARQLADNKVRLAEIDRQEQAELLKGLNPRQAAKVALFLVQFPRRVEFLARQARMRRMMGGGGFGGPPGDGD